MGIAEYISRLKVGLRAWFKAPEKVYLTIALVGVLGFAFITPPFQGPDEESHYNRVQYLANGYLVPSANMKLPKSIAEVTKVTFYEKDPRGATNKHYELHRTKEALKIPYTSEKIYKPVLVTYGLMLYLPAVPGVALANALNFSPLISLYIARVSLGVTAVLLFFLAIKLIPSRKYLLAAVGLIPTLIFQQAVVNADSVSYALLAVFISFILYLRQQTKIGRKNWLILGGLFIAVLLAKPLLYVFLPLVLLLVRRKHALRWLLGMAIVGVVLFVVCAIANNAYSQKIDIAGTPREANSSAQERNLIEHPRRGLRVLWNSYMTSYGDDEMRGVIGLFGAADVLFPLWMVAIYMSVLTVTAVLRLQDKSSPKPINKYWKIGVVAMCMVYFVGVNLALYLGYTPVNYDIVYGVQGRYFLPIIIVLATIIIPGGVSLKYRKDEIKVTRAVVIGLACCILLALFITFQRYFLYTP